MQPHVKMLWVATRKVIWEILGLITGLAGSGWPSTCQQSNHFWFGRKQSAADRPSLGYRPSCSIHWILSWGVDVNGKALAGKKDKDGKASKGGGGSPLPNCGPHGQILTLNGLPRLQTPMAIEVRRKRRSGSFSSFTPLNLIYDWKCAGFTQEKPATGWSNCQNLLKCFRSALVEQVDWVQQVVAHP